MMVPNRNDDLANSRPPDLPDLGARIKWARERFGWKQRELAQAAGVSVDVVKKAESGQTRQPRKIEKMAVALRVSPGWLAHNTAALDSLESWAITAALHLQSLSEDERKAVLAHIDALHRNK